MCLKAFIWNSHSIKPKLSELSLFTETNNIDLIFLSETWLKALEIFYLPLFDCYRADRMYGGTALLIRKAIPHKLNGKISLPFAEAVSVTIQDSIPFTVTSIYCSPAASNVQAESFFKSILAAHGPHIVAGDFNAKHSNWNNSQNCSKGTKLAKLCSDLGFSAHAPDSPTTFPPTGPPSTLDFALSRGINGISDLLTLNELSSDHLPVMFDIPFQDSVPKDEKILNFKKANWKKFKLKLDVDSYDLLNSEALNIRTTEGIDEAIDRVNLFIEEATKIAVPLRPQYKPKKTFSEELRFLTRNRNYYRNAYKRSLNPSFKSIVSQLNVLIRKETLKLRGDSFNDKLSELCVRDNTLWQFTKALKNKKRAIPPLSRLDKSTAFSNLEKAEEFAESFLQSHLITAGGVTKNDKKVQKSIDKLRKDLSARSDVENALPNALKLCAGSAEEAPVSIAQDSVDVSPVLGQQQHIKFKDLRVIEIIKYLNVKKASGPDNIANRILKNLPLSTIKLLTMIFNACMMISYFPVKWKIGKIIPIAKSNGDPTNPKSYRPISLLSNIGKIFERLILERLQCFETLNKIFIPQQFGFRNEHSTVHQILRITEDAALGFNKNQSTGLVLLDLEKAFDSVWHDGLIHKLSELKTPLPLLGIISSYLCNRQSFVVVEGKASKVFSVPAGVPQGSILSPHLFNIFINDIPMPKNCELAIYADDTAIFCKCPWKNAKGIRKLLCAGLSCASKFFSSWRIKINANKTKFIVFSKSTAVRKKLDSCLPSLNGETFTWQDCVTYLGVDLDKKLLFREHINKTVKKAKQALCTLYCIIKRNSAASEHSKISVYRSVIRPILTYACVIFNNCAKTHLNKLQVMQNKCLRMILNADFYERNVDLHERAGIPFIRDFIDKLTNNFYEKAATHSNDLIASLGNYILDDEGRRVKHRLPRSLL